MTNVLTSQEWDSRHCWMRWQIMDYDSGQGCFRRNVWISLTGFYRFYSKLRFCRKLQCCGFKSSTAAAFISAVGVCVGRVCVCGEGVWSIAGLQPVGLSYTDWPSWGTRPLHPPCFCEWCPRTGPSAQPWWPPDQDPGRRPPPHSAAHWPDEP